MERGGEGQTRHFTPFSRTKIGSIGPKVDREETGCKGLRSGMRKNKEATLGCSAGGALRPFWRHLWIASNAIGRPILEGLFWSLLGLRVELRGLEPRSKKVSDRFLHAYPAVGLSSLQRSVGHPYSDQVPDFYHRHGTWPVIVSAPNRKGRGDCVTLCMRPQA